MLSGKIALVTGAGRGIGREIALAYAQAGATVIVNYNGSREKAGEVADRICENGGRAESYGCNVADYNAVKEMMEHIVAAYGRLDILVNNAGITRDGLLMKMSQEDFDAVIDINLKGAFNCIKHVSRQMLRQKSGRIINLSSVVGLSGNAGQANYAASKAGIVGLTKSVAKELGSRGITVNAIAPGYIDTEMTQVLSDEIKEKVLEQIPLRRMGTTKDIAEMAVFLGSDRGSYITGQIIAIDGGMNM